MLRTRLIALAATAALLPLTATGAHGVSTGPTGVGRDRTQAGPAYRATITRTEHGIPHISASSFGSLGFGSGYAAAGTSICTLADTLLTARGQRSRWLGADGTYDDQVAMAGTNL